MKSSFLFLILFVCFPLIVNSWGFFGHKTINYSAVFTLPEEMFGFYKTNIETLREQSVNPDKRRYISPTEAPKHYLDADFYEKQAPLDSIPRRWDDAVALYGKDTLESHGIVPWHVIRMKYYLTKAFVDRNFEQILSLSADLGHYIGDLHVPLHSTHNYNGQQTGQEGIHGLWESRLPELFSKQYDLFTGKARYITDLETEVWQRFEESFAAKDSVLLFEAILDSTTQPQKKYSFEDRGSQIVKTYSVRYCAKYSQMLDHMVERRLRASIEFVGSVWFTAWVDAGQPILDPNNTIVIMNDLNTLDSMYTNGKRKGRMETE